MNKLKVPIFVCLQNVPRIEILTELLEKGENLTILIEQSISPLCQFLEKIFEKSEKIDDDGLDGLSKLYADHFYRHTHDQATPLIVSK